MSDAWSRRRAAARAAEAAEAQAELRTEAEATARAEAAALADLPEAEVLDRLGLPDPDAVVSGGDVRAFLARAVPRAIRDRALRSLWRSNPVLANLDGLNDYDADYTGDGLRGGALRTSYAVGKGLARHVERLARRPAEEVGSEDADQDGQDDVAAIADEIELAEAAPVMERLWPEVDPGEGAAPATAPPAPIRRMRFAFEEDREE